MLIAGSPGIPTRTMEDVTSSLTGISKRVLQAGSNRYCARLFSDQILITLPIPTNPVADTLQINFLLRAAQGWIELGLPEEAWNELQQVPEDSRNRLEVMLMSLDTLQTLKRWKECAAIGEEAVHLYPECGAVYLVTAYAIRRARSLIEAREFLLRGTPVLNEEAMFHFNLACYACQLGDTSEAEQRLQTAFQLDPKYRAQALEDTDLQPLWERLKSDDLGF